MPTLNSPKQPGLQPLEVVIVLSLSVLVLAASHFGWWPIAMVESWGFVTGGICVWLVVREHIWNWPVGLANNVVFFILFFQSRLYADMSLQVIYFALGVYGWLNWAHGGEQHGRLRITRATRLEIIFLAATIPLLTLGFRHLLIGLNGASPFWDALTTVLSLAAQYLLCRKRLENWWLWILADLIYIPLYLSRKLPLTAFLYGVFLALCLMGIWKWQQKWVRERSVP